MIDMIDIQATYVPQYHVIEEFSPELRSAISGRCDKKILSPSLEAFTVLSCGTEDILRKLFYLHDKITAPSLIALSLWFLNENFHDIIARVFHQWLGECHQLQMNSPAIQEEGD
ncbi:unnamed protein product [Rhizophagus irregularis]|nr:unnamed protein product [Rhizophagus irregularis]